MKKTAVCSLLFVLLIASFIGCDAPSAPDTPAVTQDKPAKSETLEEPTKDQVTEEELEKADAPTQEEKSPEPTPTTGQLIAHFIDVGQGESIGVK